MNFSFLYICLLTDLYSLNTKGDLVWGAAIGLRGISEEVGLSEDLTGLRGYIYKLLTSNILF